MKLFLDSTNDEYIKKYSNYVEGVTSNPILLRREDSTAIEFIKQYEHKFKNVFIQVHNIDEFNEIVKDVNSTNVIYKVPVTFDNIELIKRIKELHCRVCGTTVYDIFQFNLACDLHCDYCIVLCHKNQDDNFLRKCVHTKENYDFKTAIIAASFRTKNEVEDAIILGADYATIPPKVLDDCFVNVSTLNDCKEYIS